MTEMFFAIVVNWRLFGRPIAHLDEERFIAYMNLYNLGWIAAQSTETKGTLGRFSKDAEVKRREIVTVYRVDRPLCYFLEGRGSVTANSSTYLSWTDWKAAALW